jgi:hypothetical protein
MITQDIKLNINKIDSELKNLFENVCINEKTLGNQFYFEIKANSTFFNINESMNWKRAESIVKIVKSDLVSDVVKWSYSVNPLSESADWIERVSHIDVVAKDIYETITKSRMDKSYFESLEAIVEPINESATEITKDDLIDKLKEIAVRFELEVIKTTQDKIIKESVGAEPDLDIKLYHNKSLKMSEKFEIESQIQKISNVNFVLFKEGFILVNCSK